MRIIESLFETEIAGTQVRVWCKDDGSAPSQESIFNVVVKAKDDSKNFVGIVVRKEFPIDSIRYDDFGYFGKDY